MALKAPKEMPSTLEGPHSLTDHSCAVQQGSHETRVAPEPLKCGDPDGGIKLSTVFHFHLFTYI